MEVHHPHHPTHKKKWPEYLLEFFMLFLAVFLGFVAENVRENSVEQRRAVEYITSLVQDLKKDTSQYRTLILELTDIDSSTNGMYNCYDTVSHNKNSTHCLSGLISNLTGFDDFIYTDRTIQQLKNAGGLNLIEDKQLADSIISYDAFVRQELIHQEVLEVHQQKATDAIKSMIDFLSFSKIYKDYSDFYQQPDDKIKIVITRTSQQEVDSFFNELWAFKTNLRSQRQILQLLKVRAENLISFIQNKYAH